MAGIAVAFPVWSRPQVLRQVLDGWSKVRGVQDAVMVFMCEPGCPEAVEACRSVDFCARYVAVNPVRLGHAGNVRRSMNAALQLADYAVQALEDYLPAADLLELHAWHRGNYRDDDTVLGLTSGRDVPAPYGGLGGVWRCQLIGGMTGFHRHKWQRLEARWGEATDNGWWEWVNRAWLQSGPRYDVLFPSLSRADDIGDYHAGTCFVPSCPPQQYYEVKAHLERARGFHRYWEERC